MSEQPKKRKMLSSFSIIFIILAIVAVITVICNGASVTNADGEVFTITGATLGQFVMAPVDGFYDAVEVCFFIMVLGGFLGITTKTEALEVGITKLINGMGGNEVKLIPWLMLLFSILGSTYGFCEETIGFYALLSATMMAAGYDSLTGASMIMLGSAAGCLGSTVNPFATGIATATLKDVGVDVNQGQVIVLGLIFLVVSWAIASFFVVQYAKQVKADPSSTVMTPSETEAAEATYGQGDKQISPELTSKQSAVLWIFGIAFLIMILGFVPWPDLNPDDPIDFWAPGRYDAIPTETVVIDNNNIADYVDVKDDAEIDFTGVTGTVEVPTAEAPEGWSAFLTGTPLGEWYFAQSTAWFILLAILIGIVDGMEEKEIVDEFMAGAGDMMSVVLIVAVSRGVSVLMAKTGLDNYFLTKAAAALSGTSGIAFAIGSYVVYFLLSFLIPSTSGLAAVSMPIMGPLTTAIGYNPAVMVMVFQAAIGVVNYITPTSGALMGGLALSRIEYGTWFKWVMKVVVTTAIVSMVILSIAMMVM